MQHGRKLVGKHEYVGTRQNGPHSLIQRYGNLGIGSKLQSLGGEPYRTLTAARRMAKAWDMIVRAEDLTVVALKPRIDL